MNLIKKYIEKEDWRNKENASFSYSLQGANSYAASEITKPHWLSYYDDNIKQANHEGFMYIHDLGIFGSYCGGWNLEDLLMNGFGGVKDKIRSKPPMHFSTALGQMNNLLFVLSGEMAGAQAFSNFDTLLAPYVKRDNLSYDQVKQFLQEFIFSLNIPTRIGFQCLSEDTEILTKSGWSNYQEIKAGDTIATFNMNTEQIEYLPVERMTVNNYKGTMYHIKNRDTDQLISPHHRVVRRKFNREEICLTDIESIAHRKSGFMIPKKTKGLRATASDLDKNVLKIMAWILSDGTLGGSKDKRIAVYQSSLVHPECYQEIIDIIKELGLEYNVQRNSGTFGHCDAIRLTHRASTVLRKEICTEWVEKRVPQHIIERMSQQDAFLFLQTYLKGDGTWSAGRMRTSTVFEGLADDLSQIGVIAGFSTSIKKRPLKQNGVNKKQLFDVSFYTAKNLYVAKKDIREVAYDGVIWCPTTKNETVIARRNGKVFITGNSPFSNLTFDLTVPKQYQDKFIIFGNGEGLKENGESLKYSAIQPEMNLINKAFCDIMTEGDADGAIFTFPIPTYNITKEFDWDAVPKEIWEMTAKFGIPYFANYVNSEMSPSDALSMCCRLRLHTHKLRKRGNGLFSAHPNTGSIGVVTLNLPRIAHFEGLCQKSIEKYFNLAKKSLETKRQVLEELTERGFYPYVKHQLRFNAPKYWQNHFSTIGIIGMHEALIESGIKDGITNPIGMSLAKIVMQQLADLCEEASEETGNLFNLEATPAEGCTYTLAKKDKKDGITVQGDKEPYYTNSVHFPVDYSIDLFDMLEKQQDIQSMFTGGTVLHLFLGERIDDPEMVKNLIKKITSNYKVPYISITPTFSICRNDGYLNGEHFECPICGEPAKVYTRIVGYFRPVDCWNPGKLAEYFDRKTYLDKQK